MDEFYVPSGYGEAEFTERRSKFTGRVWLVQTEEQALEYLRQIREMYWDATHNVYAYIIRGGAVRYSDDGEPQGTAGMPVLDVLRKEGLYNVLCVVTRYFGGVLLGAGGLVRAYAHGVKIAVDAAGISQMRVWSRFEIPCEYALFEKIRKEIERQDGLIEDVEYAAGVVIKAVFPKERSESFKQRVADLSAGAVMPEVLRDEYMAFSIK